MLGNIITGSSIVFLALISYFARSEELYEIAACNSQIYCDGDLLQSVQSLKIFPDSKTFVDMNMKIDPETVLEEFNKLTADDRNNFTTMSEFVARYFEGPGLEFEPWEPTDWKENPSFLEKIESDSYRQWASELNQRWKVLGKKIKTEVKDNQTLYSLVYVPEPFIIPGGRFREFYYWDSYWIVNGLILSEMTVTVKGMITNFLKFVADFGFVPNGGRLYFTRRSQPPFLTAMVEKYLLATEDWEFIESILPQLEREYEFWMTNRTVIVEKGKSSYTLNKYDVELGKPRPESHREDVETASGLDRETAAILYSNIGSACESGWDFSSRWFGDGASLGTIRTTNLVPLDLNSVLCVTERILSEFYAHFNDSEKSSYYSRQFLSRREAVNNIFWNEDTGIWSDYNLTSGETEHRKFYGFAIAPLWAKCYGDDVSSQDNEEIVQSVIQYLKDQGVLDYEYGVPTSLVESGQQWDFPNAWPPLQEMLITSLDSTESPQAKDLALRIADRWVKTNWYSYEENENAMFEKYDVLDGAPGKGGEYDVQVGFGWTNGVILQLLDRYGDVLPLENGATITARFCAKLIYLKTLLYLYLFL